MKPKPGALSAALTYLSRQARTRRELEEYLKKKDYSAADIAGAMERLKEYGYVDDEGYARRVAEMTHQHPARGKNSLPGKLSRKGIPEELIQQTLEDYDEAADEEKALALARKHLMASLDQPWKKCLDQVHRKLFSRGFSGEVIRSVVRQLETDETLLAAREGAEEDRYRQALALALKALARWGAKEAGTYQLRQRILQSLFQQGFDPDLARRAAEEALQRRDT